MRLSGLTLLMFLAMTSPSSRAKKSDLDFRIQAFPSTIEEGKTEESEVRCDYFGPSTLQSIDIVQKSKKSDDGKTLARVALNETQQVVAQNGIRAEQTSGEIKADGQSGYLSIKWSTPSKAQQGLYECQVVALDGDGDLVESEKRVRVKANQITVSNLLQIVESLKEEVSTLKAEVGSVTGEVGSVKGEVESVKGEVESVKGEVGSVKGMVGSMEGDIGILRKFAPSKRYNNQTYYLKMGMRVTQTKAQAFCQELGGYLAEIDDRAEYDFVTGFVSSLLAHSHLVLIGGTDSAREGTWVSERTNTPLSFVNWTPGQPDNAGGHEDCMSLWNVNGHFYQMNDIHCNLFLNRGHWELGFLCEVPE